jgi:hypothetical protein
MNYLIVLFLLAAPIFASAQPITARAECISLKDAARSVISFVKQDVPECLIGLTQDQWKAKMRGVLRSISRNESKTGYLAVVCASPENAPGTPESQWKYGYDIALSISCDGTIEKITESND